MNEIYIEQNTPRNLKLICAFRQSYYKAKQLLLAQIYITVLLTVCFSTAKFVLTLASIDVSAYAVLYSVFVFIIDFPAFGSIPVNARIASMVSGITMA